MSKTADVHEVAGERLYPIRTVSSLTGVNPITLRAWERRYGLIVPTRTPKGHRLYTQRDVDRIHRVLELLNQGIPISQARACIEGEDSERAKAAAGDPWSNYQRLMINAIMAFDPAALDATYNEVLSIYPVDVATTKLILPLLKALGERWQTAAGSIAEEHFFGAYLRNKLGARFHHRAPSRHAPRFIAACLPGEHHEIGIMLFCLAAMERGFQPVLLGADIPLDQLPIAVERSDSRAVVLSGTTGEAVGDFHRELATLVRAVDVPVLVGGAVAVHNHDDIQRAGAQPLGTDISQGLQRLALATADADTEA